MTLSFGNVTVELNVFHTSSQPRKMDDHEVNMIDISVSYTFEESCYEDPLEKCLAHFGKNFDIDESIKEVNELLDFVPILDTTPWKLKVGPLSASISISVPSIIEPPKLELKYKVLFAKRKLDLNIFTFDEPFNNQSFENWVEVNKIDEKDQGHVDDFIIDTLLESIVRQQN